MKRFVIFLTVLFSLSLFLGVSPVPAKDDAAGGKPVSLTAAGSGVNLGITRLLATAFMKENPDITITVPGSIGSRGAIKAAAEGAIPLGLTSRPLKEEEKSTGLAQRPYALVAIVIGADPAVPDDNITSQELVDVYKGTKTKWKDGNPIIVQAREKRDSGFMVLQNAIPGFREAYTEAHEQKRWTLYYNDQSSNHALSHTPYAIGVTDLGMISTEHLNIKVLNLNGISPDPENVANGTYPLSRKLSFVYLPDKLPDAAKKFMDFTTTDAAGEILKANGFAPVQ